MTRWAVFLRGINVGGHNKLAMADLRSSLTGAGFGEVSTYIQSGNILVSSRLDDEQKVCAAVTQLLADAHRLRVPVVCRSIDDLRRIASSHPGLGGSVPDKWLHVALLDRPADTSIDSDAGIDRARFTPDSWVVDGREIYSTYPAGVGRSKLTIDVFEQAYAVTATARNVATLRALADRAA